MIRRAFVAAAFLALAAAPASAQNYSWSGFYLGGHGGGAWGHTSVEDTNGGVTPGPFKSKGTAAFGGGTIGANAQFGMLVIGIEGDLGYIGQLSKGIIPSSNPIYHQDVTVDGGMYGDITGRVGVALDRTLIYGKGGWAWFNGNGAQVTTKPGYEPTSTGNFSGWVAGGGIEQALGGGWSLKAEYLHYSFGSQGGYQTNVGDLSSPIGFQFRNKFDLSADTVKLGVAYRF